MVNLDVSPSAALVAPPIAVKPKRASRASARGAAFKKPRPESGIYRQRDSKFWWIRYYLKGKRICESSHSTNFEVAVKLRRQRLADADAGKKVDPAITRVTYDAVKQNLIEAYERAERGAKSNKRLKQSFAHLDERFSGRKAIDIGKSDINRYRDERRKEGAKLATIVRELAVLRKAFNQAVEDELIAYVPRIKTEAVKNAREGFLETEQFKKLRAALPEQYRDPVEFLWLTAWRLGEMRSLKWSSVYADAIRLPAANSKNKQAREVPLVGPLAELIKRARKRRRLDCQYVFYRLSRNRKLKRDIVRPLGDFRKVWSTALTAAGLPNLLVHDLRRSAVRHLIRGGASQVVAMSISGHKTVSIFQRYDITSNDDKREALLAMEQYRSAQAGGA